MSQTDIYDIECYPNCFMLGIIPLDANQAIVEAYIKADIAGDVAAKRMFIKAMKVKTFSIFKSYGADKTVKDDRRLIVDYFMYQKTLYGFNSNEYDSIMVDAFLHHIKFFNNDGFNKDGEHITTFMYKISANIINYGKGFRYTLDWYKFYKKKDVYQLCVTQISKYIKY